MLRSTRKKWLRATHQNRAKRTLLGIRLEKYHRQIRFEPLESRKLLSITVSTLVDENDGVMVGGISLREAIAIAAPGELIDFAPSLTGTGSFTPLYLTHGELVINKSLTILGPGAGRLSIDASGNDPTPNYYFGDGSRALRVDDSQSDALINVYISGLSFNNGDITDSAGAILNRENLTLSKCVVSFNNATVNGGGIVHEAGSLMITDSNVSNNRATNGGGIIVLNGAVTVIGSTLSGNRATGDGGGVHVLGGKFRSEALHP